MAQESDSDVVIRSRLAGGGAEFIIVGRRSARILGGPFSALSDALAFALTQATPQGQVFYQAVDERGRNIGEPMLLRMCGV